MIPKMILLSMILPTLILHFSIFQFPNFFISLPLLTFTFTPPSHSLVTPEPRSAQADHPLLLPVAPHNFAVNDFAGKESRKAQLSAQPGRQNDVFFCGGQFLQIRCKTRFTKKNIAAILRHRKIVRKDFFFQFPENGNPYFVFRPFALTNDSEFKSRIDSSHIDFIGT